jgi:hypothetical protein
MTLNERNCLSYWFPKLQTAGLPVPKTEIVRWPGDIVDMMSILDGIGPKRWAEFLVNLEQAANRVGTYPIFLRTGQTSGKHDWENRCFVQSAADLPTHVGSLVMWSHECDFIGLPHDVWAVREMLPVDPIYALVRYGKMPITQEVRCFISGGQVKCWHDYWPEGAIFEGLNLPTGGTWTREKAEASGRIIAGGIAKMIATAADMGDWMPLAEKVAAVFADDGAWSVDLLKTRRGYFITDMADARVSYHLEGCEVAKEFVDPRGRL